MKAYDVNRGANASREFQLLRSRETCDEFEDEVAVEENGSRAPTGHLLTGAQC